MFLVRTRNMRWCSRGAPTLSRLAMVCAATHCFLAISSVHCDSATACPTPSDMAALVAHGNDLATAACADPSDPASDPASDLDAAARDLASTVVSVIECADFANSNLAAQVAKGFVDSETCECASAATLIETTVQALASTAESSQDPAGPESESIALFDSLLVFSQNYCKPGTVDGVLDQDASKCIALSAGNLSDVSDTGAHDAGLRAKAFACPLPEDRRPLPLDPVQNIAVALASSTSDAIKAAELACSLNPDVRCALSDAHITNIARVQSAMFLEAYAPCDASVRILANETAKTNIGASLQLALVTSALSTHDAVCSNVNAGFNDGVQVIANDLLSSVRHFVPEGDASAPEGHQGIASRKIPPFERCGPSSSRAKLNISGCCADGYQCIQKNAYFAQCRPESDPAPVEWIGTVFSCA